MSVFGWVDKQLFGSGPKNKVQPQLDAATSRIGAQGTAGTDEYYKRATSFDPQASLKEAAGGLYDQFEQGVGRKINDLRGQNVGGGRLNSGYGALDESEAVYDARRDLNDRVSGLALQSEGLALRNQEDIGQFGQNQQGEYLDLLTGQRDYDTSVWNAQNKRRSDFYSTIGSLAGDAFSAYGGGGKKG